MLWRHVAGDVPAKHHAALRSGTGLLRHEHCLTRDGFEGAYTICYHEHPPQRYTTESALPASPQQVTEPAVRRRHFRTLVPAGPAYTPLLTSEDVTVGVLNSLPSVDAYQCRTDADTLYFVSQGGGVLRSGFGDLEFGPGDYICVPKGTIHRFLPQQDTVQHWFQLDVASGLGLPEQWRNPVGQLRMDAPYSERDFRVPVFQGPVEEHLRTVQLTTRTGQANLRYAHSPLDLVGYDGSVLPWAFSIHRFQPRVSSVHLPPTWHGTFSARGVLICSFVPRPVDFGADAISCPYPHSNLDTDEVIFYAGDKFTSRSAVGSGSVSLHPAGMVHGPHPGRYEASIGTQHVNELAVMLDCTRSLAVMSQALLLEDAHYDDSFTDA